ncbi:hypothetical protein PILCRDRAFT_822290 [Piloderma croceum F 1598]|uniref:Uncharacterized protein n=1 Tax=Piloderma croceum (strain F 1598) TaxID=765440 RepID=A0A0C3FKP8_PILCF|nr:hypothetical protein PILCRDRAFT_822290 [Piloderma croceum F 1598]
MKFAAALIVLIATVFIQTTSAKICKNGASCDASNPKSCGVGCNCDPETAKCVPEF